MARGPHDESGATRSTRVGPRRAPRRSDLRLPRDDRARPGIRHRVVSPPVGAPARVAAVPSSQLRAHATRLRARDMAPAPTVAPRRTRFADDARRGRYLCRTRRVRRLGQVDDGNGDRHLARVEAANPRALHGEQAAVFEQPSALPVVPCTASNPPRLGRPLRRTAPMHRPDRERTGLGARAALPLDRSGPRPPVPEGSRATHVRVASSSSIGSHSTS